MTEKVTEAEKDTKPAVAKPPKEKKAKEKKPKNVSATIALYRFFAAEPSSTPEDALAAIKAMGYDVSIGTVRSLDKHFRHVVTAQEFVREQGLS